MCEHAPSAKKRNGPFSWRRDALRASEIAATRPAPERGAPRAAEPQRAGPPSRARRAARTDGSRASSRTAAASRPRRAPHREPPRPQPSGTANQAVGIREVCGQIKAGVHQLMSELVAVEVGGDLRGSHGAPRAGGELRGRASNVVRARLERDAAAIHCVDDAALAVRRGGLARAHVVLAHGDARAGARAFDQRLGAPLSRCYRGWRLPRSRRRSRTPPRGTGLRRSRSDRRRCRKPRSAKGRCTDRSSRPGRTTCRAGKRTEPSRRIRRCLLRTCC